MILAGVCIVALLLAKQTNANVVSLNVQVDATVESLQVDDAREAPESAAREFAVIHRLTRIDATAAIATALRRARTGRASSRAPARLSPLLATVRARGPAFLPLVALDRQALKAIGASAIGIDGCLAVAAAPGANFLLDVTFGGVRRSLAAALGATLHAAVVGGTTTGGGGGSGATTPPPPPPPCAPWSPPPDTPLVLVATFLDGHDSDARDMEALLAEALRLRAAGARGVGLVLFRDQGGGVPRSVYRAFDVVFRHHAVADHVDIARGAPAHVHFALLGTSLGFAEAALDDELLSVSPGRAFDAARPASARRFTGNFIGNTNPVLCVKDAPMDTFPRPYNSADGTFCYTTPERYTTVKAMFHMSFDRDLGLGPFFVHVTSKYGGWEYAENRTKQGVRDWGTTVGACQNGEGQCLESGAQLPLPIFKRVLGDSVFTLCAGGTGAGESTRIYEALEAGSIPIVQGPLAPYALQFLNDSTADGGPRRFSPAPFPVVEGNWTTNLPKVLAPLLAEGPEALDRRQAAAMAWWARAKERESAAHASTLHAALARLAAEDDSTDSGGSSDRDRTTTDDPLSFALPETVAEVRRRARAALERGADRRWHRVPGVGGDGVGAGGGIVVHPFRLLVEASALLGANRSSEARAVCARALALGRDGALSAPYGRALAHECRGLALLGLAQKRLYALQGADRPDARRPARWGAGFLGEARAAVADFDAAATLLTAGQSAQALRWPDVPRVLSRAVIACKLLKDWACALARAALAARYDPGSAYLRRVTATARLKLGLAEEEAAPADGGADDDPYLLRMTDFDPSVPGPMPLSFETVCLWQHREC